ncbi:MAG: caspase family protein [Pseudomonadota bacterium]|nr:caspase family protein [Pseudomonadota bacterium]
MIFALVTAALAASPPSFDAPAVSGMRSKKDSAVVIGVEDFTRLVDAPGALADAAAMRDYLVTTRGIDAKRVLSINDATGDSAREALTAAVKNVKRGGMLWIYWAGHGDTVDGQRVLLGADADPEAPGGGAFPLDELVALAEKSKAKQVLVVLDVGFGGVGREGERLFAPPEAVGLLPVSTHGKVSIWSGTTAADPAYRYPPAGHGVFSYFVVGALRGWADGQIGAPADGVVSLQEAQGYVARVVRQVGGGEQKPVKETRAEMTVWALTSGALEAGPTKEDLASLALAEKARRVRKAEAELIATAKADWEAVGPTATVNTPASVATLKAFLERYDAATVTVDGAQVAVAVPQVADARGRLDEFSRVVAKVQKKKRKKRKSAKAPPPTAPVATFACQDLLALEPKAITGELTPDLTACLESRIDEEPLLTTKDKLSRMLMIDADAKSDLVEWTRLAARHLEDFDRSDPDLCFKFALVLSRGEIEDAELVLRWADYALENKHIWEGPTYMSRVYNLLRLRAETSVRMWHDAEADFIDERSEENAGAAERYRGLAKDCSREWVDYARTSAQPVDRAVALCESASGNAAFCAEG